MPEIRVINPKNLFMKKSFLLLTGILLIHFMSKAQDSTFTIDGKLENVKHGTIILNIYEGDKTVSDSASITGGSFKFTGTIVSPFFATLTIPAKRSDYFTFYIEPSAMAITGRGDSLKMLIVKGSKINDDDRLFKERMKNITAWEETGQQNL